MAGSCTAQSFVIFLTFAFIHLLTLKQFGHNDGLSGAGKLSKINCNKFTDQQIVDNGREDAFGTRKLRLNVPLGSFLYQATCTRQLPLSRKQSKQLPPFFRLQQINNEMNSGSTEVIHTFTFYMENAVNSLKAKGVNVIVSSQTPDNIWNGTSIAAGPRFVLYAQEVLVLN
jgi:hypothetical protein